MKAIGQISITAAIVAARSDVHMAPFGNQYTVSVYCRRARGWLQASSMRYHIARANASRHVVALALMELGAEEMSAYGEAYGTDGAGTVRERVILGARSLKLTADN